jgi:NMD protein affecting ribosome stability and mRNA decay
MCRPSLAGNVDLLTWFSEEERQVCEDCGERSSVSLPEAVASFCLRCGAITIDGVRVDVDGRISA